MQHHHGMLPMLEEVRDPISVYFCPAKNQYAVEICSLQKRHEQIEFLFSCHGIHCVGDRFGRRPAHSDFRSEEHTSELQSLTNLVCRLLLEKKNQHNRDARLS